MNKKVIIIGSGGHAKSIANIIIKSGDELVGFLDDNKPAGTVILDELKLKVIGNVSDCLKYSENEFVIGIGDNKTRKEMVDKYDLKYYTAIHPSANIAIDTKIGEGTVIMPNATINTSSQIGKHCIINTGAIVEHDNILQDFVHISPGASLAGTVAIGYSTHIGIGATIKNNIEITSNVIVGAGAVVVKNISESGVYIGIPAKKKE